MLIDKNLTTGLWTEIGLTKSEHVLESINRPFDLLKDTHIPDVYLRKTFRIVAFSQHTKLCVEEVCEFGHRHGAQSVEKITQSL